MKSAPLHLAGLGVGPFNLSIAALLHPHDYIATGFFDAKAEFSWHPGLQLSDARMQTSYLKDLVTGVDPCNRFSFLNYLVNKGRFYQFLNAELSAVSRYEYADYLAWVASEIPNVHFDQPVEAVTYDNECFKIYFKNGHLPVSAHNLCLGTGQRVHVPTCAAKLLSDNCFHAIDIAHRNLDVTGKRVAIIGGGQTGAEVFQNVLKHKWGKPGAIDWISRRPNFEPLDESSFTNEYFTPSYMDAFFDACPSEKSAIIKSQKLASDGISPSTLREIYQCIYELKISGKLDYSLKLKPNRELVGVQNWGSYSLALENKFNRSNESIDADIVIFCTGFEFAVPEYLQEIKNMLDLTKDGRYKMDRNFRVAWSGADENRIYAVNAGRYSHGIAEPQMSLMCRRSATIINDLVGDQVYNLEQSMDMVNWQQEAHQEFEYRAAV